METIKINFAQKVQTIGQGKNAQGVFQQGIMEIAVGIIVSGAQIRTGTFTDAINLQPLKAAAASLTESYEASPREFKTVYDVMNRQTNDAKIAFAAELAKNNAGFDIVAYERGDYAVPSVHASAPGAQTPAPLPEPVQAESNL